MVDESSTPRDPHPGSPIARLDRHGCGVTHAGGDTVRLLGTHAEAAGQGESGLGEQADLVLQLFLNEMPAGKLVIFGALREDDLARAIEEANREV